MYVVLCYVQYPVLSSVVKLEYDNFAKVELGGSYKPGAPGAFLDEGSPSSLPNRRPNAAGSVVPFRRVTKAIYLGYAKHAV